MKKISLEENKTYKFKIYDYTSSKSFLNHYIVYFNKNAGDRNPRIVFFDFNGISTNLKERIEETDYFKAKIKKIKINNTIMSIEPYIDSVCEVNEK